MFSKLENLYLIDMIPVTTCHVKLLQNITLEMTTAIVSAVRHLIPFINGIVNCDANNSNTHTSIFAKNLRAFALSDQATQMN